jgi:hypothetical protein
MKISFKMGVLNEKRCKSISCSVMSTRTRTETILLPLPMEDLQGMKEAENEEHEIIVAPVKEEAVIVEEPIYIEARI